MNWTQDTAPSETEGWGDQRHRDIADPSMFRKTEQTASRLEITKRDPMALTPAQILFLWHEHVKRGEITVWVDDHGVFHFKTPGHPGVGVSLGEGVA